MAVDMLRSCYDVDVRFYNNDQRTCRVSWYFVDESTPWLPFPTAFNSMNWDTDPKGRTGIGEQWPGNRSYRLGQRVGNALGTGPPCGTPGQFLYGQDNAPSTPTPVNLFGSPTCCTPMPDNFIHFDCVQCISGAWNTYYLLFSPGNKDCDCSGIRGVFPLVYVGRCTWNSALHSFCRPPGGVFWQLGLGQSHQVLGLYDFGGANYQVQYSGVQAWDCLSPLVIPFLRQSDTQCVWPATVTIFPGPTSPDMPLIGSLTPYAIDAIIPPLYLLCDGTAISRTHYAALFSILGTTWGAGDGTTTFNLPDLRDRVLVGSLGAIGHAGQTGGEATHTLTAGEMPSHSHSITDPGHTHGPLAPAAGIWEQGATPNVNTGGANLSLVSQGTTASATTGVSAQNTGGGGSHNNLQPYACVAWLIYAGA